jgi:hypothetical protein
VSFESEFFGPGNRLRWEAIESGTLTPDVQLRLEPFIEDLKRQPDVLVLPRVREDSTVCWYVLCRSGRVARVARDEVRAFLGPTYSDFEMRSEVLDPADPVEAAVLRRHGRNAFRLEVPERGLVDVARERLGLLVRLRRERPRRHAHRIRSAGRILRDFEYALLTSNLDLATDAIAELRSAGHLSAMNLLFLEIRRLGAGGMWRAVLALPELDALLATVRPQRVTELIIRAAYECFLREFEADARAAEAVERFGSHVFDRFRSLYRSRANLRGFEVDASFIMDAAVSSPARPDLAAVILAAYQSDAIGWAYLSALAQQIPSSPATTAASDLLAARAAFAEADVDRAFELAVHLPVSFERCALLLRCAEDMGSLAAAQVALDAVSMLPGPERLRVEGHATLSRARDELAELAATHTSGLQVSAASEEIPTTWTAWLRRLALAEAWPGALSVAEIGAREWDAKAFVADPEELQEVADLLIAERPEWGQDALRDALPFFLEFCLSIDVEPRLRSLLDNLFLVVATDERVSAAQVAALLEIVQARLRLGVSSADYREMVRQLATAIGALESPTVADLALASLELLLTMPCPDPTERQGFVIHAAGMFRRWYRRIDESQFELFRRLGEELELSDAVPERPATHEPTPTRSEWAGLDGKRVALYSLQESALRRAASVIKTLCPGVRVDTFQDHVGGSAALRTAAITADIFVLATAAAKHAATTYIEANRPSSRVTLFARGQGSTSLLQALREELQPKTASR